jgi:hypothetical protein
MVIDGDAGDLGHLDPAIQKVEFKLTVLAGEEGKVQALLQREGGQPQRRKVYFYDTKDLVLYGKDLVLRARVTQGDDDDSTVKLRPVDLADDEASWQQIGGIRIELDVVGHKRVPSAKLDGEPDRGEIEEVEARQRPVGSLFSGKQDGSSPTMRRTGSRCMSSRCWARSMRASGTSTSLRDSHTRSASRSGRCRTRLASSSSRSRFPPTKRRTRKWPSAPY